MGNGDMPGVIKGTEKTITMPNMAINNENRDFKELSCMLFRWKVLFTKWLTVKLIYTFFVQLPIYQNSLLFVYPH
jgi:hypothetical protein